MALPAVAGPPLSRLQTQRAGHTGEKRPEPPLQIFTLQYSRAPSFASLAAHHDFLVHAPNVRRVTLIILDELLD
jgi:hypothetical protein